jgi:hypothetical protein
VDVRPAVPRPDGTCLPRSGWAVAVRRLGRRTRARSTRPSAGSEGRQCGIAITRPMPVFRTSTDAWAGPPAGAVRSASSSSVPAPPRPPSSTTTAAPAAATVAAATSERRYHVFRDRGAGAACSVRAGRPRPGAARVEPAGRAPEADERLLHKILGEARVAEDLEPEAVQAPGVRVVELGQRVVPVAAGQSGEERSLAPVVGGRDLRSGCALHQWSDDAPYSRAGPRTVRTIEPVSK